MNALLQRHAGSPLLGCGWPSCGSAHMYGVSGHAVLRQAARGVICRRTYSGRSAAFLVTAQHTPGGRGNRQRRGGSSPGHGWGAGRFTPAGSSRNWLHNIGGQFLLAAAAGSMVVPLMQRSSQARDMRTGGTTDDTTTVSPSEDATTAEPSDKDAASDAGQSALQLNTGGFMIPHPQKAEKGGEDSFYIATTGKSFGVADGVSGWSNVGVDPADFSRKLMRQARKVAESDCQGTEVPTDPARILEEAYEKCRGTIGSSTACIVCLNGAKINAANIGDSGFMIVRDGKLIFESPSQQHSFNFPFQIGSRGDPVGSSQKFTMGVQPGDVIIAGSDGLLDNVFNTRTAKMVWDAKQRGATPGVAAQQLATFASARSRDPVYLSPFAKQARRAGFRYQGGKVDDITVVVSYVSEPGTVAAQKFGPAPPPRPPAATTGAEKPKSKL